MIDSKLSFEHSDWLLLDQPVLIGEILVVITVNLGMIIRIMHKNYLTFKTGFYTFLSSMISFTDTLDTNR